MGCINTLVHVIVWTNNVRCKIHLLELNIIYGIAKLTFRHDRNTVIADFKLRLPFSKTQKQLVSNPDNHWQIPDDGQD